MVNGIVAALLALLCMACHSEHLPAERPRWDESDKIRTSGPQDPNGILLYKHLTPRWFIEVRGDSTRPDGYAERTEALVSWVEEYFAPQADVILASPLPHRQESFDMRTPWLQWPCTQGQITAFLNDTLLAVRYVRDSIAYDPARLYHEALNP